MSGRHEATMTKHKSHGSIWSPGELVAGTEMRRDWRGRKVEKFTVLICVEGREVGPRGGRRKPAKSVSIVGPSWASVCRAIESLGFERPTLTATQVREGYRR